LSAGRRWRPALLILLVLGLCLADAGVQAESYDDRRVRSAARLLRALLAADEGLERKQDANSRIHVLLLGERGTDLVPVQNLIALGGDGEQARVRGMELAVRRGFNVPPAGQPRPVAVFLAEPLPADRFRDLLAWCIAEGVILYSPFEGDVERGATAGLSVQAKVQPFVNLATLKSSGIRLRRFYLEHSRVLP
jgi:hypothetical protein